MKGRITSLQRMYIHDGPGIRTVFFMKGCNMRCKWCHNPETRFPNPQYNIICGIGEDAHFAPDFQIGLTLR